MRAEIRRICRAAGLTAIYGVQEDPTVTVGQVLAGQAYVEYQIPQNRTHPYPIVMIEGCCTSGAGFNGTVDGRDGWAQYFLAQGYAVYIMDQVGRGRSPYVEAVYGEKNPKAPKFVEQQFVAYERYNLFPQAHLHTQWPGEGIVGDSLFDQFQASMLPDFKDRKLREPFNRDAGVALLDKIGPAIIMPHSQSSAYAWLMAEARPHLVKGLLMAEAASSPFYEIQFVGAPNWFKELEFEKPYGLTRTSLSYDPPAGPNGLEVVQQAMPDGPGLVRCWMQKEPAHKLVNFKNIPVLLMVGEASFQAPVAHCNAYT
jgi:pimeloyl-ACP methyl ester carboxylesterase